MGDIALATRLDNEARIRELQRSRAEHAVQLDDVRMKIARADERRKNDRGNERKWNRILDQLEGSMDQLKSVIAACDGELGLLGKRTGVSTADQEANRPQDTGPVVSEQTERKAKKLLKRAEVIDPGKLRGALEKCYGARVHEVSLTEATALLDEFVVLAERSDLSAIEAKKLDAIRSVLPVIGERMQEWQIRWSRIRK
jgi:hypothetical protein